MLSLIFIVSMSLSMAFGAHHFSELSHDGSTWRVDHFKVEEGKLQDFVETRSFIHKSQAQKFVLKIASLSTSGKTLSQIKFVTKEKFAAPLWEVTNAWNEAWEVKYAEWVAANFDKEFFVKHNLETDCADVAYALRWIFARNNKLPAAGTLAGSGAIASQNSAKAEWAALSTHTNWEQDQRFLAGLNWILNNVYTKTLYKDAYPVQISKTTIRPGLINLIGGHTEVFGSVSYNEDEVPMVVLSSTVPRAVRVLATRPYLDDAPIAQESGGLLRFRWPIHQNGSWTMIEKEKMPHYSLEQYDEKLCENETRFAFCIIAKLGMSFKPDNLLKKMTQGLEETVAQRIEIAQNGQTFCAGNDCSPGTPGWEAWSTPTRDGRLVQSFYAASDLAQQLNLNEAYQTWMSSTQVAPHLPVSYLKFYERLSNDFVSYDPRDSIEGRWALNPAAMLATITRRFNDSEKERNIQIEKAVVCREDAASCQNSRDVFAEFTTVVTDHKINKMVSGWKEFCFSEVCPHSEMIDSHFNNMWFRSPVPWHSLKLRQGIAAPAQAHVFRAEVVQNGGAHYLILDGERLYDLRTRKEVSLNFKFKTISYDESTGLFYVYTKHALVLLDQNLNAVATINLSTTYPELEMTYMGAGNVVVNPAIQYDQESASFPVWTVDLKTQTVQELGLFHRLLKIKDQEKFHLVLSGEKNLIVSLKHNKLVTTEYSSIPENINSGFYLKNDKFLFSGYDATLELNVAYAVEPSGAKLVYQSNNFYFTKPSANFLFLTTYGDNDERGQLFDLDFKEYMAGSVFASSVIMHEGQQLFLKTVAADKKQLIAVGNEITSYPVFVNNNEHLLSANNNDFTVIRELGLIITKDYSGKVIRQHSFIARGQCNGILSGTCRDPAGAFWAEDFLVYDDQNPITYRQVGLADSTEPMVFLAGNLYFSTGTIRSPASYTSAIESNVGHHVNLQNGYLMWFPN